MVYMTERDYPDAAGRPVTGRDNAPLDGGADAYAAPRADVPARMDDTAVEPLPADPVDTTEATETTEPSRPAKKGGAASSTWVALIVGALLLILLLIMADSAPESHPAQASSRTSTKLQCYKPP